jgi:hypothetical protein
MAHCPPSPPHSNRQWRECSVHWPNAATLAKQNVHLVTLKQFCCIGYCIRSFHCLQKTWQTVSNRSNLPTVLVPPGPSFQCLKKITFPGPRGKTGRVAHLDVLKLYLTIRLCIQRMLAMHSQRSNQRIVSKSVPIWSTAFEKNTVWTIKVDTVNTTLLRV